MSSAPTIYTYLARIEMQPSRKVQTKSYEFYLHEEQHTANANSRLTYSIVSAHLVSQYSNQKLCKEWKFRTGNCLHIPKEKEISSVIFRSY